jgi:hypothetical protein
MTDTTPHCATAEELRSRIEALETMRETEKAAVLNLYQQHDKLKEWVGKNYMRIKALEAGATCPHVRSSDEGTSYCGLAEQQADASAPPKSAPAGSLVERVGRAISLDAWDDAGNWTAEARAAIRAVAEWLRENECGELIAPRLLEQEVGR